MTGAGHLRATGSGLGAFAWWPLPLLQQQQQRRWRRHRRLQPQAVAAEEGAQAAVARLREQLRLSSVSDADEIVVHGSGRHQGTDVEWQLRWRGDGAFYERVCGRELTYSWGFDGQERVWEEDDSGVTRTLQLDDYEAVLLATWVRTGAWATPAGARLLEITMEPSAAQPSGSLAAAPTGPVVLAEASLSSAVVIDPLLQGGEQSAGSSSGSVPVGDDAESTIAGSCGDGPAATTLAVRLKGGKVLAHVRVCGSTWLPLSMINRVCSDLETWQFEQWDDWEQAGPRFPRHTLHHSGCGGLHTYLVDSLEARSQQHGAEAAAHTLLSSSYSMPPPPLLPADTQFLAGVPPETPAWYCPSGHILVQPAINGQQEGWMILDTGASGFVIDPKAARKLGLPAFGELHVTGMAGKVRSNFRRAEELQLGPLLMQRPLFMEMACSGLVRGAPGPVIGIVGYDVFRRAIVDIPPRPPKQPKRKAAQLAADSSVNSAAAAFAASLASGGGSMGSSWGGQSSASGAVEYRIRLYNPELAGQAEAASSSSGASSSGVLAARNQQQGQQQGADLDVGSTAIHWEEEAHTSASLAAATHVPGSAAFEALPWAPITFIANLPHLEAAYTPGTLPGLQHRRALFMLDSGAGGVDVMLNLRAVREGFEEDLKTRRGGRIVKGVGGDNSGRVSVHSSGLSWMELGGVHFNGVRALLAKSEGAGAGLDLSQYTAGIICGDLLSRCRLVLDYARGRLAILEQRPHS